MPHKLKYYKKIDGLRFIAILFVLIEHFAFFLGMHFSAGFYGVDLFFVISGFLITSILLKANDRSFRSAYRNFLGRRTLRIFPIYYIVILILWIINVEDVRAYMPYLFTYTANYGMIDNLPKAPIRHLWSLSLEEQFYLFWPFIVVTLKHKQMALFIIFLIIIVLGYAQIIFNIFPSITKYNYWGLFPRMSSLALGAMGALTSGKHSLLVKLFKNGLIEMLVFLLLITALVIHLPIKYFILGICSLYLVLKAAYFDFQITPINTFLGNRHIVFIGTISYGIYLFHLPIDYLFTNYIFDPIWLKIDFKALGLFKNIEWNPWIIKFPLYTFLSILVASLSFKYIERPILRLKNKLFHY